MGSDATMCSRTTAKTSLSTARQVFSSSSIRPQWARAEAHSLRSCLLLCGLSPRMSMVWQQWLWGFIVSAGMLLISTSGRMQRRSMLKT
ncbi:unnamed protein product [Linum tenue]|uniref:Uncharacterized protein n=1 Tax=Linum tenue TaxID=586396 RepID=A0AAV0NWI2_9ROSI|nr:unnamed protein product [Linum tenue]